jgi:hypothetical protein
MKSKPFIVKICIILFFTIKGMSHRRSTLRPPSSPFGTVTVSPRIKRPKLEVDHKTPYRAMVENVCGKLIVPDKKVK